MGLIKFETSKIPGLIWIYIQSCSFFLCYSGFMQGVVELLLEDSLVTVKSRVAEQLEKIHKIATRCKDMVGEVENKFVVVIDTLQELSQVSMSKKGKRRAP